MTERVTDESGATASMADGDTAGPEPVPVLPFGAWPSPISAAQVAAGRVRLSFPIVTGTHVWWQEGRPGDGGRVTIVRAGQDGSQQALLPAPWNALTRVHEYGGLAYLPVPPASTLSRGSADCGRPGRDTRRTAGAWRQ